jgi:hypothetical protein
VSLSGELRWYRGKNPSVLLRMGRILFWAEVVIGRKKDEGRKNFVYGI